MRASTPRRSDKPLGERIQVCVRMRPLLQPFEDEVSWEIDQENRSIYPINQMKLLNTKVDVMKLKTRDLAVRKYSEVNSGQQFTYDFLEGPESRTQDIYQSFGKKIVNSVLDGYHGTIFMYGQTTSGKTYTMLGNPQDPGMLPCALKNLFSEIIKKQKVTMRVAISYMEIYNETINDLLEPGSSNLKITEDTKYGITVKGLRREYVGSFEEAITLMNYGEEQRMYRETNYNEHSSRSHTIYQVHIESYKEDEEEDENSLYSYSCLNLVDLAGSERLNEFDYTTGAHTEETGHINKSLFLLTNVIKKLADGTHQHIPYRDSKLTRILSNALGGNSMTAIICTISPALMNYHQTMSTLRFANRAKQVKNTPVVNRIIEDHFHLQLKQEIKGLKDRLKESETEIEKVTTINEELTDMLYQTKHEILSLHKELDDMKLVGFKDGKNILDERAPDQILNGSFLDNLQDGGTFKGQHQKKKTPWEYCFGDQVIGHVDAVLNNTIPSNANDNDYKNLTEMRKEWGAHAQNMRSVYLADLKTLQRAYVSGLKKMASKFTSSNQDVDAFINEYLDSEASRIEEQYVKNRQVDTENSTIQFALDTQNNLDGVDKASSSDLRNLLEERFQSIDNVRMQVDGKTLAQKVRERVLESAESDDPLTGKATQAQIEILYKEALGKKVRIIKEGYIGYIWGSGKDGRLGLGTATIGEKDPVELPILRFQNLACGYHNTYGISSDGLVYSWGKNEMGQLGNGNNTDSCDPINITSLNRFTITSLSCGWQHAAALTSTGKLLTWGCGDDGQLGHGNTETLNKPQEVVFFKNMRVVKVTCGHSQTGAITSDYDLYTWGKNSDCRLMNSVRKNLHYPVLTELSRLKMNTKKSHLYEVIDVSMGLNHMCAITKNGNLFTAGRGNEGQLGVQLNENSENTVIEILKESESETQTSKQKDTIQKSCFLTEVKMFGKQDKAIKAACGNSFTLVLNEFNKVYSFGDSSDGCLGHPNVSDNQDQRFVFEPRLIQALVDKKVHNIAAAPHNCACITSHIFTILDNIKTPSIDEGELYIWGFNYYDQLGIGIKEKDFQK